MKYCTMNSYQLWPHRKGNWDREFLLPNDNESILSPYGRINLITEYLYKVFRVEFKMNLTFSFELLSINEIIYLGISNIGIRWN